MPKDSVKKPRRPRAETPRGFRDQIGAEVAARNEMLARICEVYFAHGFDPLETSAVETVEALGRFLPDVDRPNDGVFAWRDDDETWLALRYDLTAPLARFFAQNRQALPSPYRRYAAGPVWRDEKPGPGRFRQFYQCDADTVGSASVGADAEICGMLADGLVAAGLATSDFVVRINNRKILNGVLESVGLLDLAEPDRDAERRGVAMRAIDKLDRLGVDGVRRLLGEGRRDESGDFTPGAGLTKDQISIVLAFLEARRPDPAATCAALRELVGGTPIGIEGVDELERILALLASRGPSFIADPSVVRGLGYYTGPVFEADLLIETLDESGQPRQFGSVAGGGRYDDLVKRFTGEEVPATGVSIGVDRLLAALAARRADSTPQAHGPVVVTVMDRERLDEYQDMAAELRAAGVRAETFLGGGGMAKQMKYADRRAAPFAVIAGADERSRGVVQVKDLGLGSQLSGSIETHDDWKAQPAQVEVSRADLVAFVLGRLSKAAG